MKQCDKKSLLTLCLGAAGMSLRLLQNMTGFEPGTGLPIPGSIPGILLPVLLALSAVMLFRMNSKLPKGPVEVPLSRLLPAGRNGHLPQNAGYGTPDPAGGAGAAAGSADLRLPAVFR